MYGKKKKKKTRYLSVTSKFPKVAMVDLACEMKQLLTQQIHGSMF